MPARTSLQRIQIKCEFQFLITTHFNFATMIKKVNTQHTRSQLLKICSFGLLLVFTACDEQRRVIEPFVPAGNRVVLLEEFTGVGCTNCPKGSREIENLLTQFPNNLIAVSIHAGFFADTNIFNFGKYDFRTEEGQFLFGYLGPNLGYPAGVVDRTPVNGDMQIGRNQWASAITNDIQDQPAVELSIEKSFNASTRELVVTINGIGKENVTGEIRLSVMLTESGIVDAQDDIEADPHIVLDYVHNHVLRDMFTPADGAPLFENLILGQTFSQTYSLVLNDACIPENMEIVAFASVVNGNNFPVLQAAAAHVIE